MQSCDHAGNRLKSSCISPVSTVRQDGQIKDPVVHVRVRWTTETLKHPAYTVGWVARLCRSWLSSRKATRISHGRNSTGNNTVVKISIKKCIEKVRVWLIQLSPEPSKATSSQRFRSGCHVPCSTLLTGGRHNDLSPDPAF